MVAPTPRTPGEIDASGLDAPGKVRLISGGEFGDVFVTRIRSSQPPSASLPAGRPGEYFVAFSRLCTHMGAHLVAERHESGLVQSIAEEAVIRCPCHLTCFDLARGGTIVIGQATAQLPQLEIEFVGKGKLKLVGWAGLAYGETP